MPLMVQTNHMLPVHCEPPILYQHQIVTLKKSSPSGFYGLCVHLQCLNICPRMYGRYLKSGLVRTRELLFQCPKYISLDKSQEEPLKLVLS